MVIDAQIGQDPEEPGKPFIDGAAFAAELMSLDQQEKEYIDIWINCIGGNVIQAMNIYNAILASKTKVNTVNIGICASSAGFIYMAGRERSAWPYAKWMMHDPFVSTENGEPAEPTEGLKAMKNAIVTMISERCSMNFDEVHNMLSTTTWLDCSTAVEMKICTKVLDMQKANRKPLSGDAMAMYTEAQDIYNMVKPTILNISNSIKPTIKNKMLEKIAQSLGLDANASEDQINEAINALKVASKPSADATKIEEAMNAVKDLGAIKADLDKTKNELEDLKKSRSKELDAAQNSAAVALIDKHKNRLGKMSEDVRNAWIADAKNDATGTEAKILALPLRSGSSLEEMTNKLPEGAAPMSAMGQMAKIKNQLKEQGRQVYNP